MIPADPRTSRAGTRIWRDPAFARGGGKGQLFVFPLGRADRSDGCGRQVGVAQRTETERK